MNPRLESSEVESKLVYLSDVSIDGAIREINRLERDHDLIIEDDYFALLKSIQQEASLLTSWVGGIPDDYEPRGLEEIRLDYSLTKRARKLYRVLGYDGSGNKKLYELEVKFSKINNNIKHCLNDFEEMNYCLISKITEVGKRFFTGNQDDFPYNIHATQIDIIKGTYKSITDEFGIIKDRVKTALSIIDCLEESLYAYYEQETEDKDNIASLLLDCYIEASALSGYFVEKFFDVSKKNIPIKDLTKIIEKQSKGVLLDTYGVDQSITLDPCSVLICSNISKYLNSFIEGKIVMNVNTNCRLNSFYFWAQKRTYADPPEKWYLEAAKKLASNSGGIIVKDINERGANSISLSFKYPCLEGE